MVKGVDDFPESTVFMSFSSSFVGNINFKFIYWKCGFPFFNSISAASFVILFAIFLSCLAEIFIWFGCFSGFSSHHEGKRATFNVTSFLFFFPFLLLRQPSSHCWRKTNKAEGRTWHKFFLKLRTATWEIGKLSKWRNACYFRSTKINK